LQDGKEAGPGSSPGDPGGHQGIAPKLPFFRLELEFLGVELAAFGQQLPALLDEFVGFDPLALDPREAIEIEVDGARGLLRFFVEVGDYAAAQAFLQAQAGS
jgi:hypothetical protein